VHDRQPHARHAPIHGPDHRYGQHASLDQNRRPRDERHEYDQRDLKRRLLPGDFTIGHGAHQVRLKPVAFWTVVGTLVIMAGWSIVTASYFAFHDDVLTRLLKRQAEMQFAYEDRIAEMRAQVDRIASRQLLDQEQFEQKLESIQRRQTTLESRATTLGTLADPTVTGSIKPAPRAAPANEPRKPKASPISDTVIFTVPPDREARLESRTPADATRLAAKAVRGGLEGVLTRLRSSLDRVEARQTAVLNAMEEGFDSAARRMRSALADLGLDLGAAANTATGGPFVPYKLPNNAGAFERQIHRISLVRAHVDRLTKTLGAVPIRKPVTGETETTSGFGVRIDPFLGRPAMHTGLDFRGTTGEPVRATATGTVTAASWSGGYGKMVEIEHAHGLATRYGHLSEIDVVVGQRVKIGQIIGRLGSTGRSTGPHLHYETRIDGDAVDPQKFLRAGIRMGAL
jgi:murein DD-endopeptidase MepM/ murein hydrolase activator NlpD